MIVFFHMKNYNVITDNPFVNNSGLFVNFFFVLSGFVIAFVYLDKIGTVASFAGFLVKRFRRIYPLHLYTLLVFALVELSRMFLYQYGYFQHPVAPGNNLRSFLSSLLLLNATPLIVANATNWNYPSWSISCETIAYLLFAVLVLGLYKFRYLKYAAVSLVPLLVIMIEWKVYYLFFDGLTGFFSGVIVYEIYRKYKISAMNNYYVAGVIESLSAFFTIWMICNWKTSYNPIIYIGMFSIDIYVFAFGKGWISVLLKKKPFSVLGKYSYSIYLNHAFVIEIANFFVGRFFKIQGAFLYMVPFMIIFLTILYSRFTYRFVEVRFYQKYFPKQKTFAHD